MQRFEPREMKELDHRELKRIADVPVALDAESFAEIGRAVVAHAVLQVQDHLSKLEKPTQEDFTKVVAAIPVWVTAKPDRRDPSLMGEVCCICTRGDAGVIICRGGCC